MIPVECHVDTEFLGFLDSPADVCVVGVLRMNLYSDANGACHGLLSWIFDLDLGREIASQGSSISLRPSDIDIEILQALCQSFLASNDFGVGEEGMNLVG